MMVLIGATSIPGPISACVSIPRVDRGGSLTGAQILDTRMNRMNRKRGRLYHLGITAWRSAVFGISPSRRARSRCGR
jgi:hypothetical protein